MTKTKAEIAEAIRKDNKRISDRNYRFNKMTSEQKRVTIAKDVIALLNAEKLVASCGTYLEFSDAKLKDKYWGDGYEDPKDGTADVKIHSLIESSPSCEVCGIGACFVAAVRRADKCTVGDMSNPNDDSFMRDYLKQWFSRDQIQLVEAAFETDSVFCYTQDEDLVERAVAFGFKFTNDSDRLKAIMENIIENEGIFTP